MRSAPLLFPSVDLFGDRKSEPTDGGRMWVKLRGMATAGFASAAYESDAFRHRSARTVRVKPDVHLPASGRLPPEDLPALAIYREGLP
jgi:hypothetical protein